MYEKNELWVRCCLVSVFHTRFTTVWLCCQCACLCFLTCLSSECALQTLPWTCVWYTTKYSSFPQLSNSSPWQRWRHMSSSSSSWREKREVGKPQWHRSPARTASDFSWNTAAAMTHWIHTHKRTMHEYARPLTLSVHMSTHLSTDMFWMTALKGSARVTLSGLWKQPLKMALPSETDRTNRNVIHQQENKNTAHWVQLPSAWPLFTDPWWRDPTGTLVQSTEALTCQRTRPIAALTRLQCADDL